MRLLLHDLPVRVLAAGALLAALCVVGSTALWLIEGWWPGPAIDAWHFVALLEQRARGEAWLSLLATSHGGHRPLVSRLLHLLDYAWLDGRNVFLLGCSVVLQAALAALVIRASWKERDVPAELRWLAAGFAVAALFSATQLENFLRAWNLHWFLTFSAAAACFAALGRAGQARGRGRARWLAASVAAAAIATWSMGNGLLVWPILLGLAPLLRLPRGCWLVLAASAALLCASFFVGYYAGPGVETAAAWGEPIARAAWMAKLLGVPLAWGSERAGAWLGGAALVAGAVAILAFVLRPSGRRAADPLLVGLLAFCAGSAFVIAIGRMGYSQESWGVPGYQTLTLVYWTALACWWLLHAGAAARPLARSGLALLALAWIVAVLLPWHLREGRRVARFAEEIQVANLAIVVGVAYRPAYEVSLPFSDRYARRDRVETLAPFLRRHDLGMFADGRHHLLGRRVGADLEIARKAPCSGEVFERVPLGIAATVGLRLSGSAWDPERRAVPPTLLVSDAAGVVTGLGQPVGRRWLQAAAPARRGGWVGFSQPPTVPGRADVWGLRSDGRLCHVASWETTRASAAPG